MRETLVSLHQLRSALCLLIASALAACASLPVETSSTHVQILAINDFHGNLETPSGETRFLENGTERSVRLGGAAALGATLDNLRSEDTITVAAGDLIGASPLASALFLDEPTVRVLSEIGLDLASVGNHEFDRGIAELRRMQDGGCETHTRRQPCAVEPFAGAGFTYLAGNVVDEAGTTVFPGTAIRDIGGARIGFIGLTLQGTPNLVADSATEGYRFLDEAETANRLARELRSAGADTVVLLLHEGADVDPRYNLTGCPGLSGAVVPIVERLDASIALVVSGHTHQAYVCRVPTAAGEQVLLTSAGRYGSFVTDIEMDVDAATGRVIALDARNVPVEESAGRNAAADAIVRRYVAAAAPVADRAVGPIDVSAERGEDCIDKPAQDFVADAYLAAARAASEEPVDVAFVNSGGVRTDLSGAEDGLLTYGEIAAMAPFGNAIMVVEMTGTNLRALLEQQFCDNGPAKICQSVLTPSGNMRYVADLDAPVGQRAVSIALDGEAIDPARTYRIATNSFLTGGGDGFGKFGEAEQLLNAGFDVDALEAYVAGGKASVPVCGRVRRATALD
ncbi:bifunctional metallophosphatase/5'-nucleotidase [Aurantiacibacter spongiae]|uniref:Bifunctional metallophosphatase/5'-nucleotidase n=1 Tax=Aurantiacibacter spongiae TaxID=2488860 RepID=A0A3N5CUE2_9SPHN|nr:bifunctional metallophosphatase/5'-nucleotidase [Aurantiacibacter spongiae]RPF71946.1 bifunctional metallophosphatase/5'-nucleotidase [Aurantiacibacter spongiae]